MYNPICSSCVERLRLISFVISWCHRLTDVFLTMLNFSYSETCLQRTLNNSIQMYFQPWQNEPTTVLRK